MPHPTAPVADESLATALLAALAADRPVWRGAGAAQHGGELATRAQGLTGALRDMGVQKGTRVGVQMEPSADRLACLVALWSLGALVVPLDPGIGPLRISQAARDARLSLILHDAGQTPSAAKRSCAVGDLVLRPDPGRTPRRSDPALLLYANETRHGVVLSHGSLLDNARALIRRYDLGPESSFSVPLAMNAAGWAGATLAAILSGATLSTSETASHLILADTGATAELRDRPFAASPGVILASGEGRTIRALGRHYPDARIFNAWARAELGGIALASDPRDPAHTAQTTHGRPLSGVEVMVVDPQTGMDRLLYEVGEVWLRTKGAMLRYDRAPKASALALDRSGFFHSGEMGYLDSEGRVILMRDAHAQI